MPNMQEVHQALQDVEGVVDAVEGLSTALAGLAAIARNSDDGPSLALLDALAREHERLTHDLRQHVDIASGTATAAASNLDRASGAG